MIKYASMFFDIKLIDIKSTEEIAAEEAQMIEKSLEVSAKVQSMIAQFKAGELIDLQELDGIKYKIEEKTF